MRSTIIPVLRTNKLAKKCNVYNLTHSLTLQAHKMQSLFERYQYFPEHLLKEERAHMSQLTASAGLSI